LVLLIALSVACAWVSGALFGAALRADVREPAPAPAPARDRTEWSADYPTTAPWLRSPRILLQLALLAALIIAGVALVVMSL
jgi:hypothetical protein